MEQQAEKIHPGIIPLKEKTFEHDLAVSERYQNFSAEFLRLSIPAMAAPGFLLKEVVLQI